MPLVVKAYLSKKSGVKSDQEYEIRRFGIDEDVSTSYEYLINKLAVVFPEIARKQIRLYWRDNDGDQITFSSDEELIEGLSSAVDGVFKVYVEVQGEAEGQGECHVGVVCDGCNGSICGVRYKCNSCPDYDLCQKCKSKGLHAEHNMREIEKPLKFQFHSHMSPHHYFPPPPPLPTFPWMFEDCHQPCKPPSAEMPPPFNGGTPCPHPMAAGAFCGHSMHGLHNRGNFMRKAWKRYWKSLYRDSEDRREGKKKCKKERPCSKAEEASKNEEARHCSSSSGSEEEKGATGPSGSDLSEDLVKNAGKRLADLLLPFVYEMEVDVERDGKKIYCHKFNKFCQRRNRRGPPCCGKNSKDAGPKEDKKDEAGATAEKGCDAREASVEADIQKGNDSDWTFVKKDENTDNGVNESAEGIRSIQLVDRSDPQIVTSLSQMHSMGFYDDGSGGSLYDMMVRLEGDIEKAVEEINSKRIV